MAMRSLRGCSAGRPKSQIVLVRAAFALSVASIFGCASAPVPCRSPSACPKSDECLANRCVPLGAEPVAPQSTRLVLEPSGLAVVRPGGTNGGLPRSVSLGGPQAQNEQLLVRFPNTWSHLDIDAAFLLLEPAAGAEPTAADIAVTVELAATPWPSGSLARAPASRPPIGTGLGRTRPPALLRIDVTAALRALQNRGGGDHGLLLRAESTASRGASYSTGADGPAPRLDIYARPRSVPP